MTFADLFTKDTWGWRMSGHTWRTSPITMWVVAGGRWQVHFNRWPAKTVFTEQQARDVAMTLYDQHLKV